MVEAKIPNVAKTYSSYLGERKNCELLIGEATMNEVNEIIKKFSTGKSSGPFSIPSTYWKSIVQYLYIP